MKLKLLTLFVVMGLILSACGAGSAEPAAGGEGGGTVVLILPEEPTTLNFYLADAAIVRQVADSTNWPCSPDLGASSISPTLRCDKPDVARS